MTIGARQAPVLVPHPLGMPIMFVGRERITYVMLLATVTGYMMTRYELTEYERIDARP